MPAVIHNTPSGLIPKELFEEEKIQEYGRILFGNTQDEQIGKDDLNTFFLLYPIHKEKDTIHEITVMYHNLQKKFPNQAQAICINVYENGFNLLVLKDQNIAYSGYYQITVKEDIVYHLANITQRFFANVSQTAFFYQHISPTVLQFLDKYFEINKL